MARDASEEEPLPKGVTRLPRERGGRRYLASIRRGKSGVVHLGLYETPWLAGFAYAVAAGAIGRPAPPLAPPRGREPTAEQVRAITAKVRSRLGLDPGAPALRAQPPTPEQLLTFFEVTVVGFWREQASRVDGENATEGLDRAASRLEEAARLLFWNPSPGLPDPLEVMTTLLARRLDAEFRDRDLTRAVLDDDGDEPWRVARWLVHPDRVAGQRALGFRAEVARLYAERLDRDDGAEGGAVPRWALVLEIDPPYTPDRIRAAYRARSRRAHPDAGGSHEAFVRLRAAFEEAMTRWSDPPD